jgi:hypothetical protein
MITFKDYLEHNHPEVLDEAWWHGALAGAALATAGLAGGGPSAQGASSGSPITTTIRNYKGDKEAPAVLSQKFDKILKYYNLKVKITPSATDKSMVTIRVDGENSTRSGDARSGQVSDQINVLKGMVDDLTRGESSGVSVTPHGARTEDGKVVGGSSEPTEPFILGHGIKNPRGGGEIRR